MKLTRLGDVQIGALQIYVLDPIHAENGDVFPGRLEGSTLHVDDPEEAWRLLTEAANSADPDDHPSGDAYCDRLARADRDALTGLAGRVLKIDRAEKEKR